MGLIPTYVYKVSKNGTHLAVLPDPKSDLNFNQTINSAGCQIVVELARTPDSSLPVFGDGGIIVEGNDIEVILFNDTYPNGLTKFLGYISKWTANFGGSETIQITCLSYGQQMDNFPIEDLPTTDQSQLTKDTAYTIEFTDTAAANTWHKIGQTITTGAGITLITGVLVSLEAAISTAVNVTLSIWASVAAANTGGVPLATVTRSISGPLGGISQDQLFTFDIPLSVTALTGYFVTLEVADVFGSPQSIMVDYKASNVYAGGDMYVAAKGVSAGAYTITPSDTVGSLSDLYFKTVHGSSATNTAFSSVDPASMVTSIMKHYTSTGGRVQAGTITSTGLTADFSFQVNTVLEGIQKALQLSPQDFYWYIDVATNILYFLKSGTVADHTMIKGRHINELNLTRTSEEIKNIVYFSGGDDGSGSNVFVKDTNLTSLATYPVGLDRLSDNRVGDTPTAQALIQDDLDRNPSPVYQTTITVSSGTYDIDSFKLGQIVGFGNFNNFIDSLMLQIVAINYNRDLITLTLGSQIPRSTQTVQDLRRQLTLLQTVDNPSAPS